MNHRQSTALFNKALQYIPGGVNSPVRAFKTVGGQTPIIKSGKGAYLIDVDGNRYLDYVGSWGPLILGHAHEAVVDAIQRTASAGTSFGAPCELETQLAMKVCELMPSIEKVRFVNSGTEATMTALRLARGATGRQKIIKFIGCYHGHADALLVQAGSGALTLGIPSSPGVPPATTQDTLLACFNDIESVKQLFATQGKDIAAVIIEPIAGNMNLVPAKADFLSALRELCDQHESLLIFDEVMTGFRVAMQGAQSLYDITPDLTTLGKVIGGGMPVGAIGGKATLMEQLAPSGPIYQAGTLSGNPVCMAAGLATLETMQQDVDFFQKLTQKTTMLTQGLTYQAHHLGVHFSALAVGGMFGLYFSDEQTLDSYEKIMQCDTEKFNGFFHAMLAQGIYLAPSPYEVGFVSAAHDEADIQLSIEAAAQAFKKISESYT